MIKRNSISNTNNMELAIDLEFQPFSHPIVFRCKQVTRAIERNLVAPDHGPFSDSIVLS